MYLRTVESKGHSYLMLVEGIRQGPRVRQKVIRYFGRVDRLDMESIHRLVTQLRSRWN